MDVKHADVQLHLRKFLLSPNMFISIAVVPHKPIVHHPNAYRLVDNHVRDEYTLLLDTVHNACIPLIVVMAYPGNTPVTYQHQNKFP